MTPTKRKSSRLYLVLAAAAAMGAAQVENQYGVMACVFFAFLFCNIVYRRLAPQAPRRVFVRKLSPQEVAEGDYPMHYPALVEVDEKTQAHAVLFLQDS